MISKSINKKEVNYMNKIFYEVAAIALIALMYYSYEYHDRYYPSATDFLKDPVKYDGRITEQQGRIGNITNESFVAFFGEDSVLVKYPNVEKPKYGFLTFVGYYKKEGYIEAKEIRHNNYNDGKYIFSVVGMIIFLFIFFREWKITSRGFEDA